jgi:transcriptional regulator GlxA family with amidase domain
MNRPKDNKIPVRALFYLYDGIELLDFAGPMEVFVVAGFEVITVAKTKSPIISQGVLKIIPDYCIDDAPFSNIIAFFGGDAANVYNDPVVIQWLKNLKSPDFYFSVCTGAFILGKAGLLDHLSVTTWHGKIEELKREIPRANVLSNVRFVDNGRVITTAGVSAGIDGALHLVEKILGGRAAAEVVRYMEYDGRSANNGLIIKSPYF